MTEFRAKQVKDGWAVIDDLGEACATFGTLREAEREAARLQGIWDRAREGWLPRSDVAIAAERMAGAMFKCLVDAVLAAVGEMEKES